jgi:sugar-specific transcriptional regulator TrmB
MPVSTEELFVRAGFSRVDGRAYAALADGSASIAELCRRSGLHRPTVYRSLARLEKAGLVSTKKTGKRVVYAAAAPERLSRLASKADADNARAFERLSSMTLGNRDDVTVLSGPKGLAAVLEDMLRTLKTDDVFYRYTSRKATTNVERLMPKDYRAARDKKKVQQFVITNPALRASTYKKRTDCLSKAVPNAGDPFEYDIAVVVYGDRVATVDYAGEQAVIVRNARLAKFHARLFKLLFERL